MKKHELMHDVSENYSNSIEENSEADEIDLLFQATAVRERSFADPLIWLKANQARFPSIAKLARDMFSEQASSVASESAF